MNDNTVRKIEFSRYEDVDPNDKRRWHYVDLEEFEFRIRQEELEKHIAERRKERELRKWTREAKADLFKLTLIPRMCGILMIFMSIFTFIMLSQMGEKDGTYMLITIPLGIITLLMPGWNKPHK